MKEITRQRKASARAVTEIVGGEAAMAVRLAQVTSWGKKALDGLNQVIGRTVAEAILMMEREQMTGPSHAPSEPGLYKWGYQGGSIYMGEQKVKIARPRAIGPDGELTSKTYEKLSEPGQFSEELLTKIMSGLAAHRYEETVTGTAEHFGVSPSSVSRHFVAASAKKLKGFVERRHDDFELFAMMLDSVHRGGVCFIVALGFNMKGQKCVLGFWEGATENADICRELLADLERRGLKIPASTLFVTDGGSGICSALQEKFGRRLIHQRCTIHKDRNLTRHLASKYRSECSRRFGAALAHLKYDDALKAMKELQAWLDEINVSAGNSLREALPEILTLHRLGVPPALRKSFSTTNAIENLFSSVRHREHNVRNFSTNYRRKATGHLHKKKSRQMRRWLATIFLDAENHFRAVSGAAFIPALVEKILARPVDVKPSKAA